MTGPSEAALETALDDLVAAGVVDERPDGTLVTTETFESTRRIYRDSYATVDDAAFRRTVAEVFGVPEATAADRIDAGEIAREDLIAYLSLRSVLDGEVSETPRETGEVSETPRETGEVGDGEEPRSLGSRPEVGEARLATMATLVVELSPGSPVPESITGLDDESWRAFLDDHPDAVVTVWRRDCAPCESLKEDLDAVLSGLPDRVAVAGVDGESVPAFRRAVGVDAAPAVCLFADGDFGTAVTGRQPPSTYAERFADWYGD